MGRVIILDRDGVINEDSPEFVKRPEEWFPIPGSLEAITRLNHSGYRVVVATNQSAIGRQLFDIEMLNRIHAVMLARLADIGGNIEAIFFCPHTPRDNCQCRKPEPGLLLAIADRLRVPINQIPVVGDSQRDLDAAGSAGALPHLVRTGNGKATEANGKLPIGTKVHDDLATFVEQFLANVPADSPGIATSTS